MIKINDQLVAVTEFPNKETLLNGAAIMAAANKKQNNIITFKFEEDGDLIKLMFVKKHLDNHMFDKDIILKVLYMPYSRMDREEGVSVFTLKYVSEFVNSLGFHKVIMMEPHSNVSPALVNKTIAVYPTKVDYLYQVMRIVNFDKDKDYLLFPDAGAMSRYKDLKGYKTVTCSKERDFQTGNIIGFKLLDEMEPNRKVIIMDDLISKGGTFVGYFNGKYSGVGVTAKNMGARSVYLLTAHCEKTIFDGEILKTDYIDEVFTSDSMLDETDVHPKLTILK
ncbi:ribose-phosphate pyrophosphokinase [Bacillus phage Nigalana]|uniref:ribose-phosphate pyrophosphokinase n=1 Tax=Bacillus phage Nigalana TaxID=1805951 RepID=UPI0007A77046|nr:ribose-phosphate pyrophosphokinase [Bacillus phage Nigalana]YP_009286949.1 ribose-phosphate pyrophosphokinase [Bacillus phage Nemo]ASR78718.1 ribose-phosphate pyrophosphokinase [Bacillus phage Bubs]AXQ67567.1 ribose-phosphate pyrophosphokinase [Bacillus phage OmnioDeoPrimus]AMW61225.1 ribose-phosphate pyrophosphokinase [Bacillus phage Nigalana]AMW63550.1 ribose-phosphate pyrophosphokinase [Bacillus phage Nemo]